MTGRVFLDACVLYPPLVRRILLDAADAGLYTPLWSQRVLDEWRIAAARKDAEPAARVEAALAAMAARFPDASVSPAPGAFTAHPLPDPDDAHVVLAAAAGGADTILTFNLRDFPPATLAPHGVAPRHPDGFLWELLDARTDTHLAARLGAALGTTNPKEARRALKRARLPRLGKAWEARMSGPPSADREGRLRER